MKKFFISICIIVALFFFLEINCFCEDSQILETVKIGYFDVTTDAKGKWHYFVRITNTGKKTCNNVLYIKILKNDELWKEFTLSKPLQGSTGGTYQTSNSAVIKEFFKNRVKDTIEYKCVLLSENISIDEINEKTKSKSIHVDSYKGEIVVDSFTTDEKTYTIVLKNNSKYIIDVGIVAFELCDGKMTYKGENPSKILKPGKTATFTNDRSAEDEGCTGVLLKLIDYNSKPGSDLLFSKTYQYKD